MRVLLAAVLGFMATAAQAQQAARFQPEKRYVSLVSATVERVKAVASGELGCQLVVDAGNPRLRLVWRAGDQRTMMFLSRSTWQFPGDVIETPVMVWFDGRKVAESDGTDRDYIVMAGRGDELSYYWRADIAPYLEGVGKLTFHYVEGLNFDDSVRLPAVRMLLMGLAECRAELPAPPG